MHEPVLLNEALEMLAPSPGKFIIDGTIGGGGHAKAIIERIAPGGTFLGIDWDERAIERLKEDMKENPLKRLVLKTENYKNLQEILDDEGLERADGLLLDLGFSSDQLVAGRGFSFQEDEPLIMTYETDRLPAYRVLKQLSKDEIVEMIRNYSDERYARRIGEAIWERERKDPITTSRELAELIRNTAPKNYEQGRIDPAMRTFQAIRMYVNDELGNISRLIGSLKDIVELGGVVVIISFHSKEDRIVKHSFRELSKLGKAEILTKKPIMASEEEIKNNPRSRSAKLRAIKIT